MKKQYLSLVLFLLLAAACGKKSERVSTADGQQLEGPAAYNDYLVSQQNRIIQRFRKLNTAYESYDREKIESARQSLIATIDSVIAEVEELPPYEGDIELRDAALEMFRYYGELSENELKDIGDLLAKGESEIREEDVDEMDRLYNQFRKEIKSYEIRFADAQRAFANQHGMKIKSKDKDSTS